MHDRPYLKPGVVGMETVASMTRVCSEIRRIAPTHPLGIQILAGEYYMKVSLHDKYTLFFKSLSSVDVQH